MMNKILGLVESMVWSFKSKMNTQDQLTKWKFSESQHQTQHSSMNQDKLNRSGSIENLEISFCYDIILSCLKVPFSNPNLRDYIKAHYA